MSENLPVSMRIFQIDANGEYGPEVQHVTLRELVIPLLSEFIAGNAGKLGVVGFEYQNGVQLWFLKKKNGGLTLTTIINKHGKVIPF